MKKMRSFFHSAMGTTFMFMLAVLLLMTGTIGGVRATPQIFNPDFYYGGLELDEKTVILSVHAIIIRPNRHLMSPRITPIMPNRVSSWQVCLEMKS